MIEQLFVYGDSISMQYGFPLKDKLSAVRGGIRYNRLGDGNSSDLASSIYNGFSTKEMLSWIKKVPKMENTLLVFNCGLHDIVHVYENEDCQISISDYEMNLERIIGYAREKFQDVIFCNSTPVEDERHNRGINTRFRYNQDVMEYNKVAEKVMKERGVYVIDLFGLTDEKRKKENIYIDHVHMKKWISELHAQRIVDELAENGYIDD